MSYDLGQGQVLLFEGMGLNGIGALRAWGDFEGLMWHPSHVNPASPFSCQTGIPPLLSPKAALLDTSGWFSLGWTGLSSAEVLGGIPLGQYVGEVEVPGQFLLACCVHGLAQLPLLQSLAMHLGKSGLPTLHPW